MTLTPITNTYANTIYYQLIGDLGPDSLIVEDYLFIHHTLKPMDIYDIMGKLGINDPYFNLDQIYPGGDPKNAYMRLFNNDKAPMELTMTAKNLPPKPPSQTKSPGPDHVPGITPSTPNWTMPAPPHISDPPNLADVLWLTVTLADTDEKGNGLGYLNHPLFEGWLSNFDEDAQDFQPIPLGTLNPGIHATYKFSIKMWEGAGNEYQNLNADFDLFLTATNCLPEVTQGPIKPTPSTRPSDTPPPTQTLRPSNTPPATPSPNLTVTPTPNPTIPPWTQPPWSPPTEWTPPPWTPTPDWSPPPWTTEPTLAPPANTETPTPTETYAPPPPTPTDEPLITLPAPAPPLGPGEMPPTGEAPIIWNLIAGLIFVSAGLWFIVQSKQKTKIS